MCKKIKDKAYRIYDLENEVEQFAHELAYYEDKASNSNTFICAYGPSLNMINSKERVHDQEFSNHGINEKLTKFIIKRFKNNGNLVRRNGIGNSSKNSHDSFTLPMNGYLTNIKPALLESTHIKHKIYNLINFVKDFDQLTLTTINSTTGELNSRLMYTYNRNHVLYFYILTHYNINIISDIKKDSRVNLTFKRAIKKLIKWCSISGIADIITDNRLAASLWSPSVKTWLKDLGDGLSDGSENDPRLVSIFIETKSIDYSIDNYNQSTNTVEKLNNAIGNLKSEKHHSYSTYHLSTDEIDDYIKNYCQLE